MRIIAFKEATQWLADQELGGLDSVLDRLGRSPSLPLEGGSGFLTAMARQIARARPPTETLLLVLAYDVFPSCANPALFERYRSSDGNSLSIEDFPGHLLEPGEEELLEGLLALSLYFRWDVLLVDSGGRCRLQTSHHELMEYEDSRDAEENLSGYVEPLFQGRAT